MTKMLSIIFFAALASLFIGKKQDKINTNWPSWIEAEITRFAWIPDARGNARSGQPTLQQLETMLASGQFRQVIRLNGNGKDSDGVSHADEQALCERYGVTFIALNAHEGYQKGKGYQGSAMKAHDLLLKGETLIHCRHGYDRTGALVGAHLVELGKEGEFVVDYNGWERYLEEKPKYRKYFETAMGTSN